MKKFWAGLALALVATVILQSRKRAVGELRRREGSGGKKQPKAEETPAHSRNRAGGRRLPVWVQPQPRPELSKVTGQRRRSGRQRVRRKC